MYLSVLGPLFHQGSTVITLILTSLMILINIQLFVELVISLKNNGASDK